MKKWTPIGVSVLVVLAIGGFAVWSIKAPNKEPKVEVSLETITIPYEQDVKEKQVCAQMYVQYNMNNDSKYGTARNNTLCTDPSPQRACYLFEKTTMVVVAIKDSSESKITLYDERNRQETITATNRLCGSI